jgi:hypothetical protein
LHSTLEAEVSGERALAQAVEAEMRIQAESDSLERNFGTGFLLVPLGGRSTLLSGLGGGWALMMTLNCHNIYLT